MRTLLLLALAAACHGQPGEPKDILPDESLKGWTRIPIPPVDGLKPKLQWRADAAEHTLTLNVNGAVVSEIAGIALRRGYIGLEAEGYEITFKNLKLQPLN